MKIVCILLCFFLMGCHRCTDASTVNQQKRILMTLYFPDKQTHQLKEEKRFVLKESVKTPEEQIQYVLKELKKGSENGALESPFPETGNVKLLKFSAHLAVVDFDRECFVSPDGASGKEYAMLLSVSRTLMQISEVRQVRFTVCGEPSERLQGRYDLTKFFLTDIDETGN